MKSSRFWKGLLLSGLCLSFTVAAAASSVTESRELANGVQLTAATATVGDRPQVLYTVEADPDRCELMIGGPVSGKSLVQDMTAVTERETQTVAAVNGDHFSFKTGIPMGMSISDGEILTNPIPAYNADDYYFHALGITGDGTVLTGENPTLYMQYAVGEHICSVDRINRTRENWKGGHICLYTPRYGKSTGTDPVGVEYLIRVDEGRVAVGTMKGTILAIDEDGDMPIEEGCVVLSIHLLRYEETEMLHIGDELEFMFEFEQEEWNDVTFAVGGNRTAVADGEVQLFEYTVGAFTAAAPRSALGVKADGTLVLATADGRSEAAGGMTANEMATYLAEELGCEHAILLDGGGSTAMAVADDAGVLTVCNVPSEERPVGNGVLLVQKQATAGSDPLTLWVLIGGAAVIAIALTVLAVFLRRHSKNN
ncbi:MAG: phosphodiester glycosidase family protein [Ruminococcaceae bacterium]|nr:phosphodiester glycosidase family protein [Oscillospiraceae bacterium]